MSQPERPVLPDSGTVQFLAPAADPREGKVGTVYGAGHVTTYDASDLDYIKSLYLDGKVSLIDPVAPVVEMAQPTDYVPQKKARRTEEQPKAQEQPKQQEQPRRR